MFIDILEKLVMLKYLLVLFLLVGCFKWHPSSITCYSNGNKIYEGTAIGRIVFRDGSWEF